MLRSDGWADPTTRPAHPRSVRMTPIQPEWHDMRWSNPPVGRAPSKGPTTTSRKEHAECEPVNLVQASAGTGVTAGMRTAAGGAGLTGTRFGDQPARRQAPPSKPEQVAGVPLPQYAVHSRTGKSCVSSTMSSSNSTILIPPKGELPILDGSNSRTLTPAPRANQGLSRGRVCDASRRFNGMPGQHWRICHSD